MPEAFLPKVSIITVNYNETEATLELLESIQMNAYPHKEVIVVDNDSKVDPTKIFAEKFPEILFIRSKANLGFAGGNNLGIVQASGDFFLFVNNDAVITDGSIETLVKTFSTYESVGIVSPKFHYYYQPGIIEYAGYTNINSFTGRNKIIGGDIPDEGQFDTPQETFYCHGGGMMVSREIIEKVGMIPEEYFLYYEEMDWCEKIRKSGYKVFYQPNALIRHKVSGTIGKNSTLKTYYLARNRILFMRKNKPFVERMVFMLFLILFTIPKNVVLYTLKRNFDHLKVFIMAVRWNFGYKRIPVFN